MTRLLLLLLPFVISTGCAESPEAKFKSIDDDTLIKNTRALPASNLEGNYAGYSELARRQPEMELWSKKKDFYSRKMRKELSRDAAGEQNPAKPLIVKTRYCGLKTIEIVDNSLVRIIHASGEASSGGKYWKYDGDTLVHELLPESEMQCSKDAPTREFVVDSLSSVFLEKRKVYGFGKKEAKRFSAYTKKMMEEDNSCWTVTDGSKSSNRSGWYYVDCLSKSKEQKRWWVDKRMLKKVRLGEPSEALDAYAARDLCNEELKYRVNNPSTYDPSLLTGTSSNVIAATGKNIVSIDFSAKNSFNLELEFVGVCDFEDGKLKDVRIQERL